MLQGEVENVSGPPTPTLCNEIALSEMTMDPNKVDITEGDYC